MGEVAAEYAPTDAPTQATTAAPTDAPTNTPTKIPTTRIPTYAPTKAPTKVPTVYPTPIPTRDPTTSPTFGPTVTATNPSKPVFVEADFDVSTFVVVSADEFDKQTLAPTPMPTPMPTEEGYTLVEVQTEVQVVEAAITFDLSVAEATNPVMRASLEAGFASSLGLEADAVTVTHVHGVAVSRRLHGIVSEEEQSESRSTAATNGVDITFAVQAASNDAGEANALKQSVIDAAAEGSIVANVQKAASDNGVLTESLRDMERYHFITPEVKTETVTLVQHVRAEACLPAVYDDRARVCASDYKQQCDTVVNALSAADDENARKAALCSSECTLYYSCLHSELKDTNCATEDSSARGGRLVLKLVELCEDPDGYAHKEECKVAAAANGCGSTSRVLESSDPCMNAMLDWNDQCFSSPFDAGKSCSPTCYSLLVAASSRSNCIGEYVLSVDNELAACDSFTALTA